MMSEGYGSGTRQLTQAWRYFNAKIGKSPASTYFREAPTNFNRAEAFNARTWSPPSYLFGKATVSSRSGWNKEILWSETPLE